MLRKAAGKLKKCNGITMQTRCTSIYTNYIMEPFCVIESPWTGVDPEEGYCRAQEFPRRVDDMDEYIERRLIAMGGPEAHNVKDVMVADDFPIHMKHMYYEEARTKIVKFDEAPKLLANPGQPETEVPKTTQVPMMHVQKEPF